MIGKVSTSIFGVIGFAFIARFLQNQLSEYALITSFVGFIVVFADFGLGTLLTREVAAKRADDKYISYIFTLRLIFSIVASFIGGIVIFFFPYSMTVKIGIVILSFANVFYLLSSTIWAIFQAEIRFEKTVIAQVISSFVTCILIILVVFLKLPLLFFIIVPSIGLVLSFVITYFLYPGAIPFMINIRKFKKILRDAWPLAAGVLASVLYFKIDSLILPYFYNPSSHPDLGLYSTAYKIFEVAIVFGGFYITTLFPIFSANLYKKNFVNQFRKYLIYTIFLALAGNIILFVFARIFILIIAGNSFLPAVASLQILSFAAMATILSGFFMTIGIAGGKQLFILKFSVIVAMINVMLNLLIIPKYSFIGASWTTLITQLLILIGGIYVTFLVLKDNNRKLI